MEEILVRVIDIVAEVFFWAVFARIMLGWIRIDIDPAITRLLHEFTEPVLMPIRNMMPKAGMFDFSPIVGLLLVRLAAQLLTSVVRLVF